MSIDEVRQQKAFLLLEHQEAEDELNLLKVRAVTLGEAFRKFGEMLCREDYGQDVPEPWVKSLSTMDAVTLSDDIHNAARKVENLLIRKHELRLR